MKNQIPKFESSRFSSSLYVVTICMAIFAPIFFAPTFAGAQQNDGEQKSILEYNNGQPVDQSLHARPAQKSHVAQPSENKAKQDEPAATSADAGEELDALLTHLVLENIPHNFEEKKDWGGQKERWNGIKIWRENGRLETKRRKKLVNHGTWKKYSAELLNPEQEFAIQVKNMRETPDEKLAFDVHFQAHLKIDGRQSKWVKGVQLYSVGAEGHTKVRLVVSIELEVKMDLRGFPPDMVFVPRATGADIVVDEFRLDRIGKAGGEFAQQVSRGVRSKLDEKIESKKQKLVDKINAQFEKKKDKFRISIADAIKSKWTRSAKIFLPKSVQEAIGDE